MTIEEKAHIAQAFAQLQEPQPVDFAALKAAYLDAEANNESLQAEVDQRRKALDDIIHELTRIWEADNAELIQHANEAVASLSKTDKALRDAIVAEYTRTKDKKVAPDLGLSVRLNKELIYDRKKASAWAKTRPDFLTLDVKAFERAAKDDDLRRILGIDFAEMKDKPVAVVGRG